MFQGPSAGFSTVCYKTETRKEEEKEEEVQEAREIHGDDELQQSSELVTTDSLLKNTAHSSCHSRYLFRYFILFTTYFILVNSIQRSSGSSPGWDT